VERGGWHPRSPKKEAYAIKPGGGEGLDGNQEGGGGKSLLAVRLVLYIGGRRRKEAEKKEKNIFRHLGKL